MNIFCCRVLGLSVSVTLRHESKKPKPKLNGGMNSSLQVNATRNTTCWIICEVSDKRQKRELLNEPHKGCRSTGLATAFLSMDWYVSTADDVNFVDVCL